MPEILVPEGGDHLWEWFWDMSRDRAGGMDGPQAIGLTGIRDWCQLSGTTIRPDEVEIIRDMDAAFRTAHAVEAADQQRRREAEGKRR